MTPILRRAFAEKRRVVLPLALAILANVLLYALVVYPLGLKSAGAADRAAAAAQSHQAAARELEVARALIAGKAQAEEELNAFYRKVLPASISAARTMTYVPVVAIARRNGVDYLNRVYDDPEEVDVTGSRTLGDSLMRLTTRVVLRGEYEDIRSFIYELERAQEFLVIDAVVLLEADESEPVTLTVTLSTFYRVRTDGA